MSSIAEPQKATFYQRLDFAGDRARSVLFAGHGPFGRVISLYRYRLTFGAGLLAAEKMRRGAGSPDRRVESSTHSKNGAKFEKPFKNAPAPVWHAPTVTGKDSGVYTGDSSLLANEPYYGTSYSETISAKLNTKLTESVYNESYGEALATVIADLELNGFVEAEPVVPE